MAQRVAPAESREELERIFAFRYRVYVEELEMTQDADHERRWLRDELDEHGVSYAILEGDEILGTLRIVQVGRIADAAVLSALDAKYRLGPALERFGGDAVGVTSRFILHPSLRGGSSILRLLSAVYDHGVSRGVRLTYGDCSPHLLAFYEQMGYRRYREGYEDTSFGYKVPILMLVRDREHLDRIRSPIRRLAAAHGDDAEARAWFAAAHPGFGERLSSQLLEEELFLDLLAERVAADPLHSVTLLRGLTRAEADLFLGRATLLEVGPGDHVIRRGERDNTLYALLSGVAEVEGPDGETIAVLGAGDTFGEIGFLAEIPRTADVVARAPSTVLVLSGAFLEHFLEREPLVGGKVALNLARELAARLSRTVR